MTGAFIQTEILGQTAFATLDRVAALNTLNLAMVEELLKTLKNWEQNPAVELIVLRGAGPKSFCSGGDVKAVCLELLKGNEGYARDFFLTEYRLDHAIHKCTKPLVAVGHGFVMGGGMGLLSGAACRVVTSSTWLAMPEISIGLFPDVGGSWILNRLPGKLGLFLALTAARLNATEALAVGLADAFIPDDKLPEFYASLAAENWSAQGGRDNLNAFVQAFAAPFTSRRPPNAASAFFSEIDAALAAEDPKVAFADLLALGARTQVPWLKRACETFAKGSPTSAFVIFEELRRGKGQKLEDAFRMELDLALQCCRRHDFKEGVRALLIDKDQQPRWAPGRFAEVTPQIVQEHFESPWQGKERSPLAQS